jgi:omega-6 fatty acid desaturase (delta-12 desaturase)
VLFALGGSYQFLLKHRLPFDMPLSWKREWLSVVATNLALAAVAAVAAYTIGLDRLLLVYLPIAILMPTIGIWLFYVQHQFEETYWRRATEWSFERAAIEGSSYYDLPRVLHWFTGNIGFHHIHHLASRIPNYHLQACMREVPETQTVTRLTLRHSLSCARLHLWDEETERLIAFGDVRAPGGAP